MSTFRLVKSTNPILKKVAEPITEFSYVELRTLAKDMYQLMLQEGGIGLSAPQVGRSLRIIVVDVTPNFSGVMINPEICSFSTIEEVGREGCLSFPGIHLDIKRSSSILVKYRDLRGHLQRLFADGLLARCIQHEIDHLNGELFVDKEYIRN